MKPADPRRWLAAATLALALGAAAEELRTPEHPDPAAFDSALRAAVASAREKLEDAGDWGKLGGLYLLVKAHAAAADALHNAATLAPGEFRWRYLEGVALQRGGQAAAARRAWGAALALDPDYAPLRLRLARSKLEAGEIDAARDLLGDTLSVAAGQELAGDIALARGQADAAVTAFARALELSPSSDWLHLRLAIAYRKAGNTDKAREHLKKRGTRRPGFKDPVLEAVSAQRPRDTNTLLAEGDAALAKGHRASALLAYQGALRLDPRSLAALKGLTGLAMAAGRHGEALEYLQRALEIDPQAADAHFFAGLIHESNGDNARAESHYRRALDRETARYRLARLLLRLGRAKEAVPHLEVLARQTDSTGIAHYWLGLAQLQTGRCMQAATTLDAAHALAPHSGEIMTARVRTRSSCAPPPEDGREALLAQARRLYRLRPDALQAETLAMALAAAGEFDAAQRRQREALTAVPEDAPERGFLQANLARYANHQPAVSAWETDSQRLRPPADRYTSPAAR